MEAYLAECLEDGVAVRSGFDFSVALHLRNGSCGRGDNIGKPGNNLLFTSQLVLNLKYRLEIDLLGMGR